MWQSLRRYIEKTLFQKERPGAHLKHGAKFPSGRIEKMYFPLLFLLSTTKTFGHYSVIDKTNIRRL